MCIKLVALRINRYTGSTVARSFDKVGEPGLHGRYPNSRNSNQSWKSAVFVLMFVKMFRINFGLPYKTFFIFVSSFHTVLRFSFHRLHTVYIRFIVSHGFE